jgi:hypothetical protein
MATLNEESRQVDSIAHCCDLLSTVVFLRFAHQDHELSLVADVLSNQKQHEQRDAARISETVHFGENRYEALLNERAIAQAVVESEPGSPEEEEEEEEMAAEAGVTDSCDFDFSPDELTPMEERIISECQQLKDADEDLGIYAIGADLIEQDGKRSGWDSEKIEKCLAQFSRWLGFTAADFARLKIQHMDPPLIWVALGTSKNWSLLSGYAGLLVSLPIAETENERLFSVRKYVVGDRGGRTKNDLLTARVRIRTTRIETGQAEPQSRA